MARLVVLTLGLVSARQFDRPRGRNVCAPKVINVGLPKVGSKSINNFYTCNGLSAVHFKWKSNTEYVGKNMHACAKRHRPLFACGPCADVYAQMDLIHPGSNECYIPQIENLETLLSDHGNATFLLPTRPAAEWATSALRFNGIGNRLTHCELPSVGAPADASLGSLVEFYERVMSRARTILGRAEVKWLEFDITASNASAVLAATMSGGRSSAAGQDLGCFSPSATSSSKVLSTAASSRPSKSLVSVCPMP